MKTPSKEQAEQFFAPYIDRLGAALLGGFYEHESSPAKLRAKQQSRTRSSSINDLIVHRAQDEFEGVPAAQFVRKYGATHLILGNEYRIRFKKLGRDMRPLSAATQLFMDFLYQVEQRILPGTPDPLTNVVAGYAVNAEGAVTGIHIVCPSGKYNAWHIDLPMDAAEKPVPFAAKAEAPGSDEKPERRIRAKEEPEQATSDNSQA